MKSLYMGNVPNNDPSRVQDGTLTMTIEILAATGLVFGEPETDPGVTKALHFDAAWPRECLFVHLRPRYESTAFRCRYGHLH